MKALVCTLLCFFTVCASGNDFTYPNIYAQPDNKKECVAINSKVRDGDIEYAMKFERDSSQELLALCNDAIDSDLSHDYQHFYSCTTLERAIWNGNVAGVKKFVQTFDKKTNETCMRNALLQTSTSGLDDQFFLYKYVLQKLVDMQLPDQQMMLNSYLHHTSFYLSRDPRFTSLLLSLGADPTSPSADGTSALSGAFWMTNDGGVCETTQVLINAMNPEDFSLKYKSTYGVNQPQDDFFITPLMESLYMSGFCEEQFRMMASKANHLNQQDSNGNTSLHHTFQFMVKQGIRDYALEMTKILRDKGASMDIKNHQGISPTQLLLELKEKSRSCAEYNNPLCEKL